MNILKMCACALILAGLFGCSGKPPISVTLGVNPAWQNIEDLTITALEDVTVQDVKINRGSCKGSPYQTLPSKIAFGNSFKVSANTCKDKVIEAEVVTDKGSFTFTF